MYAKDTNFQFHTAVSVCEKPGHMHMGKPLFHVCGIRLNFKWTGGHWLFCALYFAMRMNSCMLFFCRNILFVTYRERCWKKNSSDGLLKRKFILKMDVLTFWKKLQVVSWTFSLQAHVAWNYGIQQWGCDRKSNIQIIQIF